MTCWGVKVVGESDSAGNCKFPKPSGAPANPMRTYVDRKNGKRASGNLKCVGESDSAGNCKFPKPSGAQQTPCALMWTAKDGKECKKLEQ